MLGFFVFVVVGSCMFSTPHLNRKISDLVSVFLSMITYMSLVGYWISMILHINTWSLRSLHLRFIEVYLVLRLIPGIKSIITLLNQRLSTCMNHECSRVSLLFCSLSSALFQIIRTAMSGGFAWRKSKRMRFPVNSEAEKSLVFQQKCHKTFFS